MIEQKIREVVSKALKKIEITDLHDQIVIEVPRNEDHGDYATNVAFQLAKRLRKAPPVIAQELTATINEIAGPDLTAQPAGGFINFSLSDAFIHQEVIKIDDQFAVSSQGKNQKYLVEFVSANPTGPLHIGHGRWAAIGDSICRLLRACGFKVSSEFYINDTGNQIKNFYASVKAVKEGSPIPEDGYHGEYIKDIAVSKEDPITLVLTQQKLLLSRFRCEFDHWQSETVLHQSGMVQKLIQVFKDRNTTYEKDGALWFKSTDFGDDKDRVLVRESGETTYFAADIAYHYEKYQRDIDHVVNIWGADHHGYVKRMQAAISVILEAKLGTSDFNVDDYFTVVIGQLVKLYRDGAEVRMSKRTGDMITLEDVLDEIDVDAARYFLAMKSNDQMLDFDLNLAREQSNNNPVYYVQYAHARICSILRRSSVPQASVVFERKLEDEERKLLLKLLRLPRQVEVAAITYAPYLITQYMEELAACFHSFYQKCKVISEQDSQMNQRLMYIDRVRLVLAKALDLVGVSAPESM